MTKDNKDRIAQLIPVLTAYVEGKPIEWKAPNSPVWLPVNGPMYSLLHNNFRIKPDACRPGIWHRRYMVNGQVATLSIAGVAEYEPDWSWQGSFVAGQAVFIPDSEGTDELRGGHGDGSLGEAEPSVGTNTTP